MIRNTTLAIAVLALALASTGRARAQEGCAPGQPCVVVVPQPPPDGATVQVQGQVQVQVQGQGYVQPAGGYVQQGYGQPAYGAPQQAVEVQSTRLRWGLIGPGIALLAGGWVVNWIVGTVGLIDMGFSTVYTGEQAEALFAWSFVPLVGPWVDAGFWAGDSEREGYVGIHVAMGILQLGGFVMCILGTVFPEEVTEMQYVFGEDGPALAVAPWANGQGGGLSVSLAGF